MAKKCNYGVIQNAENRNRSLLKIFFSFLSLTFLGVFSIVFPLKEVVILEKYLFQPGLPSYEIWSDPPDIEYLNIYVFNITNFENFTNGIDSKLTVEEIGPIRYLEKIKHTNVSFNENGTLSYVDTKEAIFLPHLNTIDMNSTIYVPNLVYFALIEHLRESSFFLKFGFNTMTKTFKTEPLINTTIYNFLWNSTDPILEWAKKTVPRLVPYDNIGLLARVFGNAPDNMTVFLDRKYGLEKYFQINKLNGLDILPGYKSDCTLNITGSTEPYLFSPNKRKDTIVTALSPTICQPIRYHYKEEQYEHGIMGYKYVLSNTTFSRKRDKKIDCFEGPTPLESGHSDIGPCFKNNPLTLSFPHFLYGSEKLQNSVNGLSPNETLHGSFMIFQPLMGVCLKSKVAVQINLLVRSISGFRDNVARFSNTTMPLLWMDYIQDEVPLVFLIYFIANIMPYFEIILPTLFLIFGIYFGFILFKEIKFRRKTMQFKRKMYLKDSKTESILQKPMKSI